MTDSTLNLKLPLIAPSQAQKHVTHNEALIKLDALVQLSVVGSGQSAPPTAPVDGERHIVGGPGATGAWTGHEGQIAYFSQDSWSFYSPLTGWIAFDQAAGKQLIFNGGAWQDMTENLQNLDGVGIGTSSDPVNRLAVASDCTLLSHDGSSHQLKVNRANAGDTASLLFQTNWNGTVELGMMGDDIFRIKTSNDGTAFDTALSIDPQTGVTKALGFTGVEIDVGQDSVALVPTPAVGGFAFVTTRDPVYPQGQHSGIFVYDTGASLWGQSVHLAGSMEFLGTQTLSGTTGAAGKTNVAVSSGHLQIENRHLTNLIYSVTFIGG